MEFEQWGPNQPLPEHKNQNDICGFLKYDDDLSINYGEYQISYKYCYDKHTCITDMYQAALLIKINDRCSGVFSFPF